MEKINLLETIKKFGFAEYEAKSYLALFEKESLSVSEIANFAGIPRANIYGIMQKLQAKGLCVAVPGKIKKYAASNPGILKDEMLKSLNDSRNAVEAMTQELENLYADSRTNNESYDYIEILKNPRQIDNRFYQLMLESKKEILILNKQRPSRWTKEIVSAVNQQVSVISDLIKNGVDVKCIYELTDNQNDNRMLFETIIDKLVMAGENARVMGDLLMRMAIFDEKVAIFTLVDPGNREYSFTTQVVRHPVMAKSHKLLFESMWERAEDYNEYKKKISGNSLIPH